MCWCFFRSQKETKPLIAPSELTPEIPEVTIENVAVQKRIKIKDKIIVDTFYNVNLD